MIQITINHKVKISNSRKDFKLSSKGFTLIEVVLVLAIGGLIFLLAFIAFQQVSTNRRDTQRRADVQRVIAELENYKADVGSYPAQGHWAFGPPNGFTTSFLPNYMGGDKFKEPGGTRYLETPNVVNENAPNTQYASSGLVYWPMQYAKDQKCNGVNLVPAQGSVAIRIKLEKGNLFCRSSL